MEEVNVDDSDAKTLKMMRDSLSGSYEQFGMFMEEFKVVMEKFEAKEEDYVKRIKSERDRLDSFIQTLAAKHNLDFTKQWTFNADKNVFELKKEERGNE